MKVKRRIKSNDVLVTHLNCMDGATCAAVFMLAGGYKSNIHYVPASGGVRHWVSNNKKILNSDCNIYIADVSADHATVVELEKRGNVILLDHHKSALGLKNFSCCHIDMSQCGCRLLFEEIEVPAKHYSWTNHVTHVVNDFDLWINGLTDITKHYLCYFDLFGQEKFADRIVEQVKSDDVWTSSEEEMLEAFDAKRQKYIRETAARVHKVTNSGVTYGCVFVSSHRSEVLNRVLENDPSIDVAAGFLVEEEQVSLRSRKGGVDVSKIAESYGGGGHENAAAFSVDPTDLFGDVF